MLKAVPAIHLNSGAPKSLSRKRISATPRMTSSAEICQKMLVVNVNPGGIVTVAELRPGLTLSIQN